jgi:hypothetical protein
MLSSLSNRTNAMRFGKFTSAQEKRINAAKNPELYEISRPGLEEAPLIDTLESTLPPAAEQDLSQLPIMSETEADKLDRGIWQHFVNTGLSRPGQSQVLKFREQLAEIVGHLAKAEIQIPDSLVETIEWAYGRATIR